MVASKVAPGSNEWLLPEATEVLAGCRRHAVKEIWAGSHQGAHRRCWRGAPPGRFCPRRYWLGVPGSSGRSWPGVSGRSWPGATREVLAGVPWEEQGCPMAQCGAHMCCSTAAGCGVQQGQGWPGGGATNVCLHPLHSSGCRPWPPPSQCPVEPSCPSSSSVRARTQCGHGWKRGLPASPCWGTPGCPPPQQPRGQGGAARLGRVPGDPQRLLPAPLCGQGRPSGAWWGRAWQPGSLTASTPTATATASCRGATPWWVSTGPARGHRGRHCSEILQRSQWVPPAELVAPPLAMSPGGPKGSGCGGCPGAGDPRWGPSLAGSA